MINFKVPHILTDNILEMASDRETEMLNGQREIPKTKVKHVAMGVALGATYLGVAMGVGCGIIVGGSKLFGWEVEA